MTISESTKHWKINSEADFQSLMSAIDETLRNQGIPIPSRQLHALLKAATLTGQFHFGTQIPDVAKADDYSGDSLSMRVMNWMSAKYGERLKVDFNLGAVPIRLSGDSWLLHIPTIVGQVRIVCDPNLSTAYPRLSSANLSGEVATINLFQLVQGLSQTYAAGIDEKDARRLLDRFCVAQKEFGYIEAVCVSSELISIARTDLIEAATFAVEDPPSLGLSRWHALQGAEKSLKALIESRHQPFPKVHDLKKLAEIALPLGLTNIEPATICAAQCTADVRYDQKGSTIDQAINAHDAALSIAGKAASAMLLIFSDHSL